MWQLIDHFKYVSHHLLSVSVWLILASWLSAFIGAIIYYVWQHDASDKSVKGFFIYSFPMEIIEHRSTRLDCIFVVLNYLTDPFIVGPLLIATASASLLTYEGLSLTFGNKIPGPSHWWLSAIVIVIVLFVQDFMVFLTHYLEHKVPILWEIHKVHHSLPVMTPLSNRRHHPWQLVWEGGCTNIAAGSILGLASYIANVPILDNIFLGTDAYFIASTLSFYQLRHSHIPLHYGRFEKWFLSPAQHQLHHSFEERDWDRNFSLWLSFWDRMAGTITYTEPKYQYRIGLPEPYEKDYDQVWKFYLIPPYNIGKILLGRVRRALRYRKSTPRDVSGAHETHQ